MGSTCQCVASAIGLLEPTGSWRWGAWFAVGGVDGRGAVILTYLLYNRQSLMSMCQETKRHVVRDS